MARLHPQPIGCRGASIGPSSGPIRPHHSDRTSTPARIDSTASRSEKQQIWAITSGPKTPVDRQRRAGDIRRSVRAQEQHPRRDLLGTASPAERHRLGQLFLRDPLASAELVVHRGLHARRTYRVDPHALTRDLERRGPRQSHHRVLRRVIHRVLGAADQSSQRRVIDDRPDQRRASPQAHNADTTTCHARSRPASHQDQSGSKKSPGRCQPDNRHY